MITLTADRQIGPLLRQLRRRSGLTMRQLAAKVHISASAVSKREHSSTVMPSGLIATAHVFGYDVALIPKRCRHARPTGTGWPA